MGKIWKEEKKKKIGFFVKITKKWAWRSYTTSNYAFSINTLSENFWSNNRLNEHRTTNNRSLLFSLRRYTLHIQRRYYVLDTTKKADDLCILNNWDVIIDNNSSSERSENTLAYGANGPDIESLINDYPLASNRKLSGWVNTKRSWEKKWK